jgi:hypothetical protein
VLRVPTDLQMLDVIYRDYGEAFAAFDRNAPDRETKLFVPIDVEAVAAKLHVDPDIVFGRLYYHLEKKYGYDREGGSRVAFFTPRAGKDSMCVNYPLLSSVVADLREQRWKFSAPMYIALVSLLVSFGSLVLLVLGSR